MKKLYKAALLAALGLGSMVTAQAATYNNDLIVGFTTKSGNDVVYDLGAASSLTSGETWNLSSLLSGFSSLSSVNWGVIGASQNNGGTGKNFDYVWSTTAGIAPLKINGLTAFANENTAVGSIYSNFGAAGAGQSLSIAATDDNSWNTQTISGSLTGDYVNAYGNPNVVGVTSDSLFQILANNTTPTLLGNFALGADDVLTFSAVPEPISFGAFAGAGLLLVSLRNQLRRKQA
jgi:hypothetical protein